MRPPFAVTMGDPAGIGPDVTLAMWHRLDPSKRKGIIIHGCPVVYRERAARLGLDIKIIEIDPDSPGPASEDAIAVAPIENPVSAVPGQPDSGNAPAIIESIERAVGLTMAGKAAAVITNPIAKAQLYSAGFSFPGHTEFLAELSERLSGKPVRPVMMLAGPRLRAVPVTIHIPLRDVPSCLTTDAIVATGRIVAADLKERFDITEPVLALAGLNPHAGESRALGQEDEDVIAPAVARLQTEGIKATGPHPADTMFHADARRTYDAALCMYHDQALIPAKALDFDETVNVTLGLPFVRTSPDHGTAFDLAGSGQARADSLIAAVKLARRLTSRSSEAESEPDGRH